VKADTLEPLRAAARRVNPAIIPTVRWMKSDLERRLEAPKLTSMVSAGVGLLTMALTAIGIFGLVAYTVSLRTREVGIRLALGAGANHVLWLVLKGLMGPIVLGALLGALVVMFGLAGILRGEPFYAEAADPVAIALGLLVLGVSGAAACLAPAARALRISPTEALRQQ
jgi:ABC-type antimicrobial peptide transport system permease subunit